MKHVKHPSVRRDEHPPTCQNPHCTGRHCNGGIHRQDPVGHAGAYDARNGFRLQNTEARVTTR